MPVTSEERILLKRIKEAWNSIDSCDFKEMEENELIEEMNKW